MVRPTPRPADKRKRMELGETGFRPDDPARVETFNLAMDATGADLSVLCNLLATTSIFCKQELIHMQ